MSMIRWRPQLAFIGLLTLSALGCHESGSSTANDSDLAYCVSVINQHRAAHSKPALTRSPEIEACAAAGAREDAASGRAHGHFSGTGGCGFTADAENEIPGWPLGNRSIPEIIDDGTQMMMDEGPGGGHYENILGEHEAVGCGIYVTDGGEVWIVQDFK